MIFFLYAVHIFHNSNVAVVAYTLVVSVAVNKYAPGVVVETNKYVAVVDCIDATVVVADKNTFVLDTIEVFVVIT